MGQRWTKLTVYSSMLVLAKYSKCKWLWQHVSVLFNVYKIFFSCLHFFSTKYQPSLWRVWLNILVRKMTYWCSVSKHSVLKMIKYFTILVMVHWRILSVLFCILLYLIIHSTFFYCVNSRSSVHWSRTSTQCQIILIPELKVV